MNEYKQFLEGRGLSEYFCDGAIKATNWSAERFKILFLLKENWGYQGCGILNTSDEAHGWLDAKNPTYLRITRLAAILLRAIKLNRELSDDEIDGIWNNFEQLHEALDRIAVVNIKKHSGQSKSNDTEIRREARLNASLLTTQISSLEPDMIVAGGDVCWDALNHDFDLLQEPVSCERNQAVIGDDYILCHTNHPSAWTGGGFSVKELHRVFYAAIKTGSEQGAYGQCYQNSLDILKLYKEQADDEGVSSDDRDRNLALVHGDAWLSGKFDGHAWVEMNGRVFDTAVEPPPRVKDYYDNYKVRVRARYTHDEALKMHDLTASLESPSPQGVPGPWDREARKRYELLPLPDNTTEETSIGEQGDADQPATAVEPIAEDSEKSKSE